MALVALTAFAQTSIKVQTHNVVAADEQFNVTFIIEGEDKSSDFTWEPGEDFQLLWGPQQGRSTSVHPSIAPPQIAEESTPRAKP